MKSHSGSLPHTSPRSQRGLSLIELMISLTIGLLILVSLTTMFVGQTRARSELDKANRMIDNGRYALDLLSSSIRMAGYYDSYDPWGPFDPVDLHADWTDGGATWTSLPNPCDTGIMTNAADNRKLLRLHVQGYNATTATNQIASPPCSLSYTSTNAFQKLKDGSDILVIRRASTATPITQATAAGNPDGTIYLQVSTCEYDTTPYKIVAATSVAFANTMTLGQRNVAATGNCLAPFGVPAITAPYANVRPMVTEIYFISPDNVAGDGIPTLKRTALTKFNNQPAMVTNSLVEGIEFMQVEYGIDDPALNTDGVNGVGLDGAPDSYTAAPATLAEWSNVVTVKLHLIARNIDATGGYSDPNTYSLGTTGLTGAAGTYTPSGTDRNYKRHGYTQLVRLVNVSGRREAE